MDPFPKKGESRSLRETKTQSHPMTTRALIVSDHASKKRNSFSYARKASLTKTSRKLDELNVDRKTFVAVTVIAKTDCNPVATSGAFH